MLQVHAAKVTSDLNRLIWSCFGQASDSSTGVDSVTATVIYMMADSLGSYFGHAVASIANTQQRCDDYLPISEQDSNLQNTEPNQALDEVRALATAACQAR
jgi:hypothetical protein